MKKMSSSSRISSGQIILLLFATLPGMVGVVVFGSFVSQTWPQLQRDYTYFNALIEQSPSLEALFVAEAQQNIHRLNLMTDAILTLLSAILAAIGLYGATQPRR